MYPLYRTAKVVDRVVGAKSKKTRVTCAVAPNKSTLLVGTSTGDVFKYTLIQSEAPPAPPTSTLEVKRHMGSGKKKIDRLLPVPDTPLVLALVAESVIAISASTLLPSSPPFPSPKHVLGIEVDAAPSSSRVALITKKKVSLLEYSHTIGDFVPLKELGGLPSSLLSCVWYGDTLCLGFKRKISAVSIADGSSSLLCSLSSDGASSSSSSSDPHQGADADGSTSSWIGSSAVSATSALLSSVNPWSHASGSSSGSHPLLMVAVPNVAQILVLHGAMGVFYNASNGALSGHTVTFSGPPTSVDVFWPHVVGLLDGLLEVRSVEDANIYQSLPLAEAQVVVASSGMLTLHSEARVWVGLRISFEQQLAELIRGRRFDDAVKLFQIRVPSDSPSRGTQMKLLYENCGFQAIVDGDYKTAFQFFSLSDVDPRDILAVFSMLPSTQREYSSSSRPLPAIARKVATQGPVGAHPLLIAFLEDRRSMLHAPDECVDTALLRLYIFVAPEKIGPLLDHPHAVVMADGLAALKAAIDSRSSRGPYNALALVLAQSGDVVGALDIWEQLQTENLVDPNDPGIGPPVRVLGKLEGGGSESDTWDLIRRYGPRLFASAGDEPEKALPMFVSPDRVNPLDHDAVLVFLDSVEKHGWRSLQAAYLQYAISGHYQVKVERFQTMLINILVDATEEEQAGAGLAEARKALLDALEDLPFYDVEAILERISGLPYLDTETIVLYRKVGHHYAALRILVHVMGDHTGAEAYAQAVHKIYLFEVEQSGRLGRPLSKLAEAAGEVWMSLLTTYLQPEPESSPEVVAELESHALAILQAHVGMYSLSDVLELLPPTMSLSVLAPYIQSAYRASTSRSRHSSIHASLLKGAHLQATLDVHAARAPHVVIDEDTVCSVCYKRIGANAFARYPNEIVVHFKCVRDPRVCPVTGDRFGPAASSS